MAVGEILDRGRLFLVDRCDVRWRVAPS